MIYPAIFKKLSQRYTGSQKARQVIIGQSNNALRTSKRAIFALHRGENEEANKLLLEADSLFKKCENKFKTFPKLAEEGAYRAALEEYAEALLYQRYLTKGKFGPINKRAMQPIIYLAGLCDTTGEIVRFAVREATEGRIQEVRKALNAVEMTVSFLYEMDLTGYLRTKFDQAKKNLSRLEQMCYDLKLRDK